MPIARNTDLDWAKIAEENPYWGVISAGPYMGKDLDEKKFAEFFSGGEMLISNIFAFIKQHFGASIRPNRALDFGCGVGRLLAPLARLSVNAVGVDVAPNMLKLSLANLQRLGITNATLVQGDDTLSRLEGTFDFINTYIVLQHIPPERGLRLLDTLLGRLEVGGFASLQLTYGKARRFWGHEAPKAKFYRRDGNLITDLAPADSTPPDGTITMYDYDLNQIMALVGPMAGSHLMILPTCHDDHLGIHFIFQRVR